MERQFLKGSFILSLAVLCLLLVSCDEFYKASAAYRVFGGNYSYFRGDYQKANILYLRAEDMGQEPEIIAYNLGTVYQALGETESAMEQWNGIVPGENFLLAYRLVFNRGVLHYQLGEYQAAYDLFREALLLEPASMTAKINLEYSFRKLNIKEQTSPAAGTGLSGAETGKEEVERILEYIRRTEMVRPPEASPAIESAGGEDW